MASVLFTIGGAVVNALDLSGTNFVFSRLIDYGAEERKRDDLSEEKLKRARDEWNRDQIKRLDFINKKLRGRNKERAYIKNFDEAMLEYYRVFAKRIRSLPPDPEFSDFYPPSQIQKNGELLFVAVGTSIVTYALYKYIK